MKRLSLLPIFLIIMVNSHARNRDTTYMSLKSTEVNMRGGPGTDFSILYTYKSRFMPVKVVGEYDKWFKIVDKDDDGGWISGHLLSKTRTVITLNDVQILYSNYNREAYPIYKVKKNVIARLLKCKGDRCKVKIGKVKGWLDKNCIWGHNEDI